MSEKRFTYNFVSVDCPLFYDEGGVIDYDDVVDLLNELYEENQTIKDVLIDLNKIDNYWDSALLQGYIDKIANILGVDFE